MTQILWISLLPNLKANVTVVEKEDIVPHNAPIKINLKRNGQFIESRISPAEQQIHNNNKIMTKNQLHQDQFVIHPTMDGMEHTLRSRKDLSLPKDIKMNLGMH